MRWLFTALPYVLAVGSIALGAFEVQKKLREYEKAWARISVAALFVLVGAGSLISLYHDNTEKEQAAKAAEKGMRNLQANVEKLGGEVEQANRAQESSTKTYLESISELKAEVRTEALQKKLTAVEDQLLKTQKAMAPGPKAELVATLEEVDEATMSNLDVHEKWAPKLLDDSVEFTVHVVNKSKVMAKTGFLFLQLCRGCEFKVEPANAVRNPGAPNTDREIPFERFPGKVQMAIPLKVKPPPNSRRFQVDVIIRCENCEVRDRDKLFITF